MRVAVSGWVSGSGLPVCACADVAPVFNLSPTLRNDKI